MKSKLTIILVSLLFSHLTFAKLTVKETGELNDLCIKKFSNSKEIKNYASMCACATLNIRYLSTSEFFEDFRKILADEPLTLEEESSPILGVFIHLGDRCSEDPTYLAPNTLTKISKELNE